MTDSTEQDRRRKAVCFTWQTVVTIMVEALLIASLVATVLMLTD